MNSASLCSLAGRYDNPIPPRFLAPIDSLKISALYSKKNMGYRTLCYRADDYKTSPYLKIDFEVQLSTPTTTNVDECFLIIQKLNKQKEKGEYEKGEGRGWS